MQLYFITPHKLDLELPQGVAVFSRKARYHKFILWDTFKGKFKRSRAVLFQEGQTLTLVQYDKKGARVSEERFRVKPVKTKAARAEELSRKLVNFTGESLLFPSSVTLIETTVTLRKGPKAKEFRSANSKAPFLYSFESGDAESLDALTKKLLKNGFKKTELPLYLADCAHISPFAIKLAEEESAADFLARFVRGIDALKKITEIAADEEIFKEIKRREEFLISLEELPPEGSVKKALPSLLKQLAEKALKGKEKAKKRLKRHLKYLLPLEDSETLKKLKGWKKRIKALLKYDCEQKVD